MLVLIITLTNGARSSQYSFQNEHGRPSAPMAFVDPMARIAFLVVAIPTQCSSNEGVPFAMFLINSRALAMVSPVAEEVWTLLTSLSTFCMKYLLHSSAHSTSDLQLFRRGSLSVFPRLSTESASLHAAACRFLEASDIFFMAVCMRSRRTSLTHLFLSIL